MTTSTSTVQSARPQGRALLFWRKLFNGDQFARAVVFLAATGVIAITCLLVYELWIQSELSRDKFGWSFLNSSTWNPITDQYGAAPFIFGTVVTALLALLIAVVLGVGAAIFLAELAPPRTSDTLTFLIELLAAVPSVIFGLMGIFVLIPILQNYVVPALKSVLGFLPIFSGAFYGVSIFSAAIVLAIMVLPFIISVSREVLLAVPRDLREAALAVGATKWESTWQVVVPFARTGIIGSIFLALARALGETMAVTMVIGNTPRIPHSLLAPGYSIAAVIANEFSEASGDVYRSALIELGLVLFALTIVINAAARLLIMATTAKGTK